MGGASSDWTDEELASALSSGDETAFRMLADRYLSKVYAYCARVTGDGADAEDLSQDVFLRLWRNASQWDEERLPFEAWLMVLARHRCIDYLRRKQRRPRAEAIDEDLPDERADPGRETHEKEVAQRVQDALMKLPFNQRSAIVLRYYQGYSNEETAAILDVTVYALESLLKRGKANLRRALGDFGKWQ